MTVASRRQGAADPSSLMTLGALNDKQALSCLVNSILDLSQHSRNPIASSLLRLPHSYINCPSLLFYAHPYATNAIRRRQSEQEAHQPSSRSAPHTGAHHPLRTLPESRADRCTVLAHLPHIQTLLALEPLRPALMRSHRSA